MKRIFSLIIIWLVLAPMAVAIVVFALNNREMLVLDLWPLAMTMELPVYLAMLAAIAIGAVLGSIATRMAASAARARLVKKAYDGEVSRRELETAKIRTSELERELAALRQATPTAAKEVSAQITGPFTRT